MKVKKNTGIKIVCNNRKASFNYFFEEFFEAGIVLKGSEVKALRDGKANITDAYANDDNGEIYLINSHIPLYKQSSYNNHNPRDMRKLLLNKKELRKIEKKLAEKGLSVVPTRLFINDRGLAKLEVAVSRGKKLYDKRESMKERDSKRELKNY